jgi:hypothetical protein
LPWRAGRALHRPAAVLRDLRGYVAREIVGELDLLARPVGDDGEAPRIVIGVGEERAVGQRHLGDVAGEAVFDRRDRVAGAVADGFAGGRVLLTSRAISQRPQMARLKSADRSELDLAETRSRLVPNRVKVRILANYWNHDLCVDMGSHFTETTMNNSSLFCIRNLPCQFGLPHLMARRTTTVFSSDSLR